MKQCPYCKAEIEDSARFCLYCMKPLNEKEIILPIPVRKRGYLAVAVAVILVGALILTLVLLGGREPAVSSSVPTTNPTTQESSESDHSTPPASNESVPVIAPEDPSPSESTPSVPPQPVPEETEPEVTQPEATEPEATEPEATEPEATEPEATEPETTPQSEVKYLYRAAQAGDDFNAHYANDGNDIVITGVEVPSEDGVYHIPAYIDGKRVIAIMGAAFSSAGSNAREVYLPSTVRNVWDNAFAGCPLEHIYFTQNTYIATTAFPASAGILTIHCPRDCQDRNYRYFRSSAEYWYHATYEEWP